ncbi:HtaA domain-containing protein [Streptomyces sp. NBC_01477]|uniref:HtaA domain-containing protein n=1 Tax=Streptomyces sp. NBC_01477 TaxID=2976015 RepID=UPI002E32A6F1|nr:HtaA domain-containing protein [Streptomyces sp. NBC_01477]
MPSLRHARVRSAALAATVAAVLCALLVPAAATAHAAPGRTATVSGGRLDWGIKASFQSYVTGPIAHGSWNLTGSADTVGSEQFRFPSARGSYDPAAGALSAAFAGGVHFVGHRQSNGAYQLDLTISRPAVRISGRTGTLYADMASKDKDTGKVTTASGVPLASLALGGVDTRGVTGPRFALTGVPATLTAQGARAFAGYYTAGTALDPVSLSVDLHTPSPSASAPAAKPSAGPSAPAGTVPGTVMDAAVDWGVRRTFREYVSGDIAKGRWELADGAREGGALFRFGAGQGTYDPAKHTLDARFAGSVRFLGMRAGDGTYGLDLTIGTVRVAVTGGKGTLYADGVPFVTFPAALTPKAGLIAVTEAPATLTPQGAAAFKGLYTAGTPMDPLTLSVALDKTAALPALPDIGSAPTTPAPAPTPTTTAAAARPAVRAQDVAADSDGPSGALVRGAAAVVLAAAVAGALAVRRHRRRTVAAAPATEPGPDAAPAPDADATDLGPDAGPGPDADTRPHAGTGPDPAPRPNPGTPPGRESGTHTSAGDGDD